MLIINVTMGLAESLMAALIKGSDVLATLVETLRNAKRLYQVIHQISFPFL